MSQSCRHLHHHMLDCAPEKTRKVQPTHHTRGRLRKRRGASVQQKGRKCRPRLCCRPNTRHSIRWASPHSQMQGVTGWSCCWEAAASCRPSGRACCAGVYTPTRAPCPILLTRDPTVPASDLVPPPRFCSTLREEAVVDKQQQSNSKAAPSHPPQHRHAHANKSMPAHL